MYSKKGFRVSVWEKWLQHKTKKWLPKTPIWNPSYETIEATLNDKKTEYWYYLHDLSGKIYYWKTDAEHEANKKNFMNKK